MIPLIIDSFCSCPLPSPPWVNLLPLECSPLLQVLLTTTESSLPPVLCRTPAEYEDLPVTSVNLQLCLEEERTGQQQRGPRLETGETEETGNYPYFYSIVIVGSISVILLILIFSRRRLVRALTKSRWGILALTLSWEKSLLRFVTFQELRWEVKRSRRLWEIFYSIWRVFSVTREASDRNGK